MCLVEKAVSSLYFIYFICEGNNRKARSTWTKLRASTWMNFVSDMAKYMNYINAVLKIL